jgi:hypothetical protein
MQKNLIFYHVICHIWLQVLFQKLCEKCNINNKNLPHDKCSPWKGLEHCVTSSFFFMFLPLKTFIIICGRCFLHIDNTSSKTRKALSLQKVFCSYHLVIYICLNL